MPHYFPRRTPRYETPEQARIRQEREEIANARAIAQTRRSLSSYKRDAQDDWDIMHGSKAAKAAA